MLKYLRFKNCNCEFKILSENPKRIEFIPELSNIPLNCPTTWDLIASGNTKSLFQLDSRLSKNLAERLKPHNIDELSALISISRPGCLEGQHDGKSITDHYIDRKNGKEKVEYFHPSLEPILKNTQAELLYQEQIIRIAVDIAGFTLQEGDELRVACSKKKSNLMAETEIKFLEGCKQTKIVNENEAKEIFSWIEKSQRYSFNASILSNTKVTTIHNQEKTIDELQLGEYIKCPNTHNNKKYTKVLNKFEHGYQPVCRIELQTGKTITCTLEHKFLCENNKIYKLSDIIKQQLRIISIDRAEDIINVTELPIQRVVDIEVDHPQHLFYGNGIVTSNSHATAYALNCYISAYTKAHFPKEFYTSWLYYSGDKPKPFDEIRELVNDARLHDIEVYPPNFNVLNPNFKLIDDKIYFGFNNIKGIGEAILKKIKIVISELVVKLHKETDQWNWLDFLLFASPFINKTAVRALIGSGSLSYFSISRRQMILEYDIYMQFTNKEQNQLISCRTSTHKILLDVLTEGVNKHEYWDNLSLKEKKDVAKVFSNKNRFRKAKGYLKTLEYPPYDLEDSIEWIVGIEKSLLGISLSCSIIDAYDKGVSTINCKELNNGTLNTSLLLACTLDEVKETKTKTGKNIGAHMAFMTASDNTGSVDNLVIFPNQWQTYKNILQANRNVLLLLHKSKDRNSYFVNKAQNLSYLYLDKLKN